jgi:hypothetical protein
MEEFGDYLKQLRIRANLERPEVRYELRSRWGISLSEDALALWEGGKIQGIPAVPLACLARLYGVSFEDLFGRLFTARFDGVDGPVPTDPPETDTPPSPRRARPRRGGR